MENAADLPVTGLEIVVGIYVLIKSRGSSVTCNGKTFVV